MKKYFSIFAAALIAVPALCLTACSDDNDNPDDPNNGGGTNTGAAAVDPSQVFTNGIPSQVGDNTITTDDQGRMTKITDNYQTVTFEYNIKDASRAGGIPTDYDVKMTVS